MALFTGGSTPAGPGGAGRRLLAEQGPLSLKERFGALRNLPPLFRLVWQTSAPLTTANLALRLVRSASSFVRPSCTRRSLGMSSELVASSRMSTAGFARNALANEISCRCPALTRPPRLFTSVS